MSLEQTVGEPETFEVEEPETFENRFKVPEYMDAPWLTIKYVKKFGWYPVPDEWLQHPNYDKFEDTSFGKIPWKSRSEYSSGDIIIFSEYFEWKDENGGYDTDRFITIEQEEIGQYKRGERDLLPVGVVIHPPQNLNLGNKLEFKIMLVINKIKNYINK
jgi:hypothetical protein